MRSVSPIIIIFILNYACCQRSFSHYDNVVLKSIKQPLDHFNETDKRTLDFPYYAKHVNNYSQPNAPIYIWLTGDLDDNQELAELYFINDSCVLDQLVKETNGSVYLTFKRYVFWCTEFLPYDKDFFNFLTTEQVLADYAYLIKRIKSQPGYESSKVVLVGTNEGGQEATWMRMVYPDLVDAVIASNAALLAKKDFPEYFDVIHNAYEKYGTPDCLDKIGKYYHTVEEQLKTPDGIKTLMREYEMCNDTDLTLDIDKQQFWYRGLYNIDGIFITMGTSSYIKSHCENTLNGADPLAQFPIHNCTEFHVDYWKNSFYTFSYIYQQCSEFGQFRTSSGKRPFLHLTLDYHLQICKLFFDIDEKRIDEGIAKTNAKFGGLTPNVTNVVFTYGELNPYRLLGVQKNLSDNVVSFVIDGVGSRNVPYVSSTDSKELIEARKAAISLIKKWIA